MPDQRRTGWAKESPVKAFAERVRSGRRWKQSQSQQLNLLRRLVTRLSISYSINRLPSLGVCLQKPFNYRLKEFSRNRFS